jgi:hypothetical protein
MTRINVGIKPKELPNKLLLAEHREIKRIPNMVRSGRTNMQNIPTQFTLGTGHVKFFYSKLGYIKKRYIEIYLECISRSLNVTYYGDSFDDISKELMNDYEESLNDRNILLDRIHSKGFKLLSEQ